MPIRLDDLLWSFRRHLRAAAKAPRTIELYGREPVLEELTRHAISAWLADLAETSEPSTVLTRLRGMRRFCRWLVTEGELTIAPTDSIEIPTPPERPVPILSDEEITALLKTCTVPRGRARGVRPPELCGLDLTDVDLVRELALVTARARGPAWSRSVRRLRRPSIGPREQRFGASGRAVLAAQQGPGPLMCRGGELGYPQQLRQ